VRPCDWGLVWYRLKCGGTIFASWRNCRIEPLIAEDTRGESEIGRLRSLGLNVLSAAGDVSDPVSVERMAGDAIGRLGGLDYLVNNAGTSGTKQPIAFSDLDKMSEEFWERIISTNLLGPFRCTKFAASALRAGRGAVVNTASIGGIDAVGSSIAYGASKAGLINMTKNLARALGPEVRVNAVAPGYVETGWTADWPEEKKTAFAERSLLKRACKPRDIAEIIVFLCHGAKVVTGQTIVADAGFTLA